jgi:hypothetical protein
MGNRRNKKKSIKDKQKMVAKKCAKVATQLKAT